MVVRSSVVLLARASQRCGLATCQKLPKYCPHYAAKELFQLTVPSLNATSSTKLVLGLASIVLTFRTRDQFFYFWIQRNPQALTRLKNGSLSVCFHWSYLVIHPIAFLFVIRLVSYRISLHFRLPTWLWVITIGQNLVEPKSQAVQRFFN